MTAALAFLLLAGNADAAKAKTAVKPAPAPIPVESEKLKNCLKRADDLPDMAAADAAAWIKSGGGNEAHLCRAFAQSNRGMHEDSAREFWALASYYRKRDAGRTLSMNELSAQEFMRARDYPNAEERYTAALKIAPRNTADLTGRAQGRMAREKYWDALDDLNRALKISPGDADALRQRGRAWIQLGNVKNAQEDFAHAEDVSPAPDADAPHK